jgi:hypothetical protein
VVFETKCFTALPGKNIFNPANPFPISAPPYPCQHGMSRAANPQRKENSDVDSQKCR